jgi:hypothetical protein
VTVGSWSPLHIQGVPDDPHWSRGTCSLPLGMLFPFSVDEFGEYAHGRSDTVVFGAHFSSGSSSGARLCVCCVFLLSSSVGLLFNGFRSSPMLALKKHLFVGGVLKYSRSLVSQILIVYSNNVCYQQFDRVY